MTLTSDFATALSPERKIFFSYVFGRSEIPIPLETMFFTDKKWGVLFSGRSEILNPLLCSLGDQKFWILFCVYVGDQKFSILLCVTVSEILNHFVCHCRGSEMLNPFQCSLGIKFWTLRCVLWGIRISESFDVFFGDQKFWILSFVVWGIGNFESRDKKFQESFGFFFFCMA